MGASRMGSIGDRSDTRSVCQARGVCSCGPGGCTATRPRSSFEMSGVFVQPVHFNPYLADLPVGPIAMGLLAYLAATKCRGGCLQGRLQRTGA